MKRVLLTLTCFLAFAVSAFATEERVSLPQDQGTWYLTVFGEAEDAKFVELQSWLTTDTGLVKLKAQVRFNKYTTDQERYKRYIKDMPGLPCIRLQDEKGLVVSEFWGDNIPTTSSTLYQGIKSDLKGKSKTSFGCLRRRRQRNCPTPQPKPEPPPTKPVEPPTGPPVLEPDEPESEESNLWILLTMLSALIGGSLGFVQGYKAEHSDKPSPTSSKL